MVTSVKLSLHSIGIRRFFSRQLLLVMVAAALFAILWVANVRGPAMGWFPILLYVLFIGNLTTPIMNRLAPIDWPIPNQCDSSNRCTTRSVLPRAHAVFDAKPSTSTAAPHAVITHQIA